ncbi:DUF4405 domain-containing protein [Methanosarcina barkeri]|uniref:DUF4405 domain-containing protein n=1 Tax=Methanosarcina barkeri TaxID=2208 RepID=UPI000AB90013|nr:DUF4405 domain-containing protein [Methanosarcina barkeri]
MRKINLNYLVDLAFFVQFALVGYSGLIMYFNHHAAGPILRLIHDKVGILMLLFFVVHIALHWRWIVLTTKNFFQKRKTNQKDGKSKTQLSCGFGIIHSICFSGLFRSYNVFQPPCSRSNPEVDP